MYRSNFENDRIASFLSRSDLEISQTQGVWSDSIMDFVLTGQRRC